MVKTFDSPGIENISTLYMPCNSDKNDVMYVGVFNFRARLLKNQLIFKERFNNCYFWMGVRGIKTPKIR